MGSPRPIGVIGQVRAPSASQLRCRNSTGSWQRRHYDRSVSGHPERFWISRVRGSRAAFGNPRNEYSQPRNGGRVVLGWRPAGFIHPVYPGHADAEALQAALRFSPAGRRWVARRTEGSPTLQVPGLRQHAAIYLMADSAAQLGQQAGRCCGGVARSSIANCWSFRPAIDDRARP